LGIESAITESFAVIFSAALKIRGAAAVSLRIRRI
jgi:hypothetical protein